MGNLLTASYCNPYLLGQIGLVGNTTKMAMPDPPSGPYLLGQIGLVGNGEVFGIICEDEPPYLLGQIGLVGNSRLHPANQLSG